MRHALDHTGGYKIVVAGRNDDRNGGRCFPRGVQGRTTYWHQQYVDRQTRELGAQIDKTLRIVERRPIFEDVIAPLYVAVLPHPNKKPLHGGTEHPLRLGPESDKADARNVALRYRNIAR